ncbi:MAG TPA: uracil-DNA glycosylase, partial [Oligoflexia bacterium]|nr:uracil-DNA glycosylase [Oligoflexia bacterium]
KRAAFAAETYWGKPVPSFGDPAARLFLLGLAPAAHGANRTGRMFTGDNSGLWLYRALYKAGFASQPESRNAADGLQLRDAWISATVHCAPPENKPTLKEIENCAPNLMAEFEYLSRVRVILALGAIAYKEAIKTLRAGPLGIDPKTKIPKFSHGVCTQLPHGRWLLGSYHPSQQNTFTKRLTEPMFDEIFKTARRLLDGQAL